MDFLCLFIEFAESLLLSYFWQTLHLSQGHINPVQLAGNGKATVGQLGDLYADGAYSLFRRVVIPKGHYSEKNTRVINPKGLFPEGSLFRKEHEGHYSEGSLFRKYFDGHFSEGSLFRKYHKGHFSENNIRVVIPKKK